MADESQGLDPDKALDSEVNQYVADNPSTPIEPDFVTGADPFDQKPVPALETDPNITVPTTPDDTLPSGLAGTPPADAMPATATKLQTTEPGQPPPPNLVNDPGLSAADNKRESDRLAIDQKKAGIEAEAAQRDADDAQRKAEEAQAAHVQYLADRQAAQDRLDAKTAAFEAGNKLVDPSKNVSTKSKIAVLFSGLGSAMAGGTYRNSALEDLHKSWDADTERQKENIASLKDSVVMARTGLKDVDEGRRELQESANAKNLATYNAALKQGRSQLANLGMDQAAIDSDDRIQALKAARAAAADRAQKDQDAHLLNQARVGALDAQAQKNARRGSGTGISSKEQFRRDEQAKKDARADDATSRQDAAGPLKEWGDEVKDLKKKGGLIESIHHGDAALKNIADTPDNPSTWVGAIDAAIKTNTGRSAVMSQYNLFMGHAAGKDDTPDQLLEKFKTGLPSQAQRAAILQALKQSNASLHGEASDAYENFRLHADDPRIKTNEPLRLGYTDLERSAFGTLPEYVKPKGAKAAPASAPPAPPSKAQDTEAVKWAKSVISSGDQANAAKAKAILKANGL